MKIVLDVSAAYALIVGKPGSESLNDQIGTAELVIAPDLFYAEATNTAWKYFRFGGLQNDEVIRLAERSIQLVDMIYPTENLWMDAIALAIDLKIPAYDCYYLALAINENASLLTLDKKLSAIALDLGIKSL